MNMNQNQKIVWGIVIVLALIVGGWAVWYGSQSQSSALDNQPDGAVVPNQQTQEAQEIVVPKESFEGGKQDLKLTVGDTYGKFTITKIFQRVGSETFIVQMGGEETVRGRMGFSSIGLHYLTVDSSEANKLPQIYKNIFNNPVVINALAVNASGNTEPNLNFIPDADPRPVEVIIKNLELTVPPTTVFGSVDVVEVKFLDN